MSSGQKRRIPDNFPDMKYRAAKRHARNHPVARAFRTLGAFTCEWSRVFASIDWTALQRSMERWVEGWRQLAEDLQTRGLISIERVGISERVELTERGRAIIEGEPTPDQEISAKETDRLL